MRRALVAAAAAVACWAGLLAPAAAEPELVDFRLETPERLTVGDRFHYVLTLEAAANTEIGLAPGSLPPELALIGQPAPARTDIGDGMESIVMEIEIAAFTTGAVEVPALSLVYTEPDGTAGEITTQPSVVVVSSVLPQSGDVTPRDLKPQAVIGSPSALGTILTALAAVLVALVVILLVLWRLARRPAKEPQEEVDEAELGPEDRARAILGRAGAAFAADRDFVEYYSVLAVTIRNYLTERYGFPAFALTTSELQHEMLRRGIDRWQARLVDNLFSQCDAAVYARYEPALERADHDLTAAFEIVEMSRPKPPAETEAETREEEAPVA